MARTGLMQKLGQSAHVYRRALAVLAAGLLLTEVNVHGARIFKRWDVSQQRTFSVSSVSRRLLTDLKVDVKFSLLLSADSPFRVEVKYLLDSYRATNARVSVETLDPDRDPVRYLALLRSIGELSADRHTGRQPVVVAQSGSAKWVIYEHQLSRTNEAGEPESLVEQCLSEAIAQLRSDQRDVLCFLTGHGEASLDDVSPNGLTQLVDVLRRSHIESKRTPLDLPAPEAELASCTALALVGPERPLPAMHAQLLERQLDAGKHLWLWLDPVVTEQSSLVDLGLGGLLARVGVSATAGFVLESDPSLRLPSGMGESFFVRSLNHPITQGLSTDAARFDARVLFSAATPLAATTGSSAAPLLATSERARALLDLRHPEVTAHVQSPLTLAFANELRTARGAPVRSVVVGSSNLPRNEAFLDASQHGNRVFVENSLAWLFNRAALVSIPPRQRMNAGINLSEESLSALLRYVLLYMPLCAAAIGSWMMVRRRPRAAHAGERQT